jgi:hypothetical protein
LHERQVADLQVRYNQKWTHRIQDAIYVAMLNIWLGGLPGIKGGKVGDFFTIDDIETLYTSMYFLTTILGTASN